MPEDKPLGKPRQKQGTPEDAKQDAKQATPVRQATKTAKTAPVKKQDRAADAPRAAAAAPTELPQIQPPPADLAVPAAKKTRRAPVRKASAGDGEAPTAPKTRAKRAPRPKQQEAQPEAVRVQRADADLLSVLMVTPEAHPFAKTGGLAEVTAALADGLTHLGHSVTLVIPGYRGIEMDGPRLQTRLGLGDRLQPVSFVEKRISDRLTVVVVDVPELFDREALYGTAGRDYPDNPWRFAVFSRAAVEYPRLKEWRPSVIHAHDWQAGLVPVYQKMLFSSDPFVGGVPAVFTLHNLAFQGIFPASTLPEIGLGYEVLDVQGMEFWGNISYLKGGINFSEKITTVSPGYAREIVRPELGFGLEGVLARRSRDLVGILNGIDTTRWTPSADPYVPARFSADDLGAKREAKRMLLAELGLPADEQALERPVVGLVSRLTGQKGFDLMAAASDDLMALDAAWVMLGSGERRFEDAWRALAASRPRHVSTTIGFDERLAHMIEAGSDMFLMPSRFEPCGLNQMYSLRYGTVPIVRATGGLDDTVVDVDEFPERGTGFKFLDYTPGALLGTVRRALASYREGDRWQEIQRRGMREDHSWDASAAEYVKLYGSTRGREAAAEPQTP
jgi:starch synthase